MYGSDNYLITPNQSANMTGKNVLITGGTGGIGKATAEGLAHLGARVILVGRDKERGAQAVLELQTSTGNPDIEFLPADLSSQTSIRQMVQTFETKYTSLDVLINNVGGIFAKRAQTTDGIEATLALNHLAAFLLTNLLLNRLKVSASARIVNINAASLNFTRLNFDDLEAVNHYKPLAAYGRAKLANLFFTYELARRLIGSGVTVNAINPGGADTDLSRSKAIPSYLRLTGRIMAKFMSMENAAGGAIYLASSPKVAGISGRYFNWKKEMVKSSNVSYDKISADRLWQISRVLTKLN